MFCNINAKIKQFDKYVSLIINDSIIYIVAVIVDNTLYIFLLFLFTIGLLCVSAGEKSDIPIIDIRPIIIFAIMFKVIIFIIIGKPMNVSVDDMRHIQLFDA